MTAVPSVRDALSRTIIDFLGKPFQELGQLVAAEVRMYRVERAVKIMRRAKKICNENNIPEKDIPLKFLVPFMEVASCEDDNIKAEEMWANLLASARLEFKPEYRSFIDILSQLDPHQALLLDTIMSKKFPGRSPAIADLDYIRESQIAYDIEQALSQLGASRSKNSCATLLRKLYKQYNTVGFVWEDVAIEDLAKDVSDGGTQMVHCIKSGPEKYIMENIPASLTCFDLLQRQYIIKGFSMNGIKRDNFIYSFGAYRITSLGIDFYRACTGQKIRGPHANRK
jgi:hypothetical protein